MPKTSLQIIGCWGNSAALLETIKEYRSLMAAQSCSCSASHCRYCSFIPDDSRRFKLHSSRERVFFVVHDGFVRAISTALRRWRCPDCRRTFTEYPRFARPYRRYTVPQMERCAAEYSSSDDLDYRGTVQIRQLPIFHANCGENRNSADRETLCYRILAHTSVFHWVTQLGSRDESGGTLLGNRFEPAPKKYRSESRRLMLIGCYRVFTLQTSVNG